MMWEKMIKIDEINFSSEPYSQYSLLQEAKSYLGNMKWCKEIENGFVGVYIEGILAVFKFIIIPFSEDVDKELWVITGKVPPAYLVTDYAQDSISALKVYAEEISLWINAVLYGEVYDRIIPVNIQSTKENAIRLKRQIDSIVNEIIPEIESTLTLK